MNSRLVGVGVVIIGILIIAHPLYLWPHYGEGIRYLEVTGPTDSPMDADEWIAYSDLPPAAQQAFQNPDRPLYMKSDATAIAILESHQAIRYRGKFYRVYVSHEDGVWILAGVVRLFLSIVGGILVSVGVLFAWTGEASPLTPLGSLSIIPILLASVAIVDVIDWIRLGDVWVDSVIFGLLFAVPFVGFVVFGSGLRLRDQRFSALGLVAGIGGLAYPVVVQLLGVTLPPVLFKFPSIAALFLAVLMVPTTIVSNLLTEDPPDPGFS